MKILKVAREDAGNFSLGRIYLPAGTDVVYNQQYNFSFNMTAPSTIGIQDPDYRMVQENVTWFGDYANNTVLVK